MTKEHWTNHYTKQDMTELETAHCPFTSKVRITKKSLQRPELSLEHEHFGLCVTHTQIEKSNMLSLYVVEIGNKFFKTQIC